MASNRTMNSNQQEAPGPTATGLIDEMQEKELRLVLIGKSGHGKSSLGNTLCNREAFSTSPVCASHTKRCCPAARSLDDIEIIVYDTPGLFDTSVDYNIIKKQLCHAVTSTASPGPHAFLIVLEAGRFTEEEQKTVQLINDMFGKDAGKYCILIITREDDILHHKLTLEKYIERSTAPFKNLLAQCQNRILAINNRAGEDEREKKVLQLITIVRKMLLENQSPYYTSDMFQQAEKELRQREEAVLNQAKEQMEEQKRAVRDELRREFEEEAQKQLTQLTKQLRLYQRDELAKDGSCDMKSLLNYAGILTENVGRVVIKLIEHQEHRSLLENDLLYDRREAIFSPYNYDSSPIITHPMDREALPWPSSIDPTELNNAFSTIEIKETDSSSQDQETDSSLQKQKIN